MSRLGYLQFTAPSRTRNTELTKHLLSLTQPYPQGQPGRDLTALVWSWLGCTLSDPSSSHLAYFGEFFSRVPPLSSDIPASGLGVAGDGGWLDHAFNLVESTVEREGAPSRSIQWLMDLMSINFLDFSESPHLRVWDLGATENHWPPASGMRLPSRPPSSWVSNLPRPAALEDVFDLSFARQLNLLGVLVEHSRLPHRHTVASLGFSSRQGDTQGLARCVGQKTHQALVTVLEKLCDTPKDQPAWGLMVPVMNLAVAMADRFEVPSHLLDKAYFELNKPANTLPGEPEGRLVDWASNEVSPRLSAWLTGFRLDSVLANESTGSGAPRLRM